MSQSSPEGIILGKGSKLVSLDLSINDKNVLIINSKQTYTEDEVHAISQEAYAMGRNNLLIGVFNKWFAQIKKKK
jgi:hypothetical protein